MSGAVFAFLLAYAAKATLVLAAAALLAALLRRAAAETRALVWSAALAGVLLLAPAHLLLPRWSPPVLRTLTIDAAAPRGAPEAVAAHRTAPGMDAGPGPDWRAAAALAWLAGAAGVLAWLACGPLHRRALLRRTEPVDGRTAAFARRIVGEAGIRRTVRVRRGPVPIPVTWGALRPVVLLPESAAAWDDARLEPVLRHEVAHVARLDALGRMVAQAACGVLWFHPLAWHGARRLAAEQEHAADDAVLRAGAEPAEYAQALLRMARDARGGLRPAGAIPAAHPSRLEGRLLAILDPERRAAPPRRRSAALASLAVALVLAPVAAAAPGAGPIAVTAAVQPDSGRIRAEWRVDGTRMEAIIRGDVRISEEPERIRVPAGGLLTVEEVAIPRARRLAVTPGPGGVPAVAWTVGGRPAPLDAEARAWLRPWLRHVAAELRFAAARDTLDRERQALRAAPRPANVPEAERRRVLARVDAVARRRQALSEMPPGTPEQGVARDLLRLQLTREEMRLLASIGMAP